MIQQDTVYCAQHGESPSDVPLTRLLHRSTPRWLEHALGRGRRTDELGSRPTRADHEFTAAIRTLAVQNFVRAGGAERAFEGADARFSRLGRQIAVAAWRIPVGGDKR